MAGMTNPADQLTAERAKVARLREALEQVVLQFEDMQGTSDIREDWHRIARQALEETKR